MTSLLNVTAAEKNLKQYIKPIFNQYWYVIRSICHEQTNWHNIGNQCNKYSFTTMVVNKYFKK